MKAFFLLLLLVNAVLAIWIQLGPGSGAGAHAPAELRPEKIRLLSVPPAPPAAEKSAALQPAACLEWEAFAGTDLRRAEAAIARLQLGSSLSQRVVGEIVAYWVHIPPLSSGEHAERKIAELKRLGVTDYFHVQDGSKWNHAISMDIFRSEETARRFLAELRNKGVRSAIIGERSLKQVGFVVRDPAEDVIRKMTELKQQFAGSGLKTTRCETEALVRSF